MASELPRAVDCRRLLAHGGRLVGEIDGSRCERIDGLLRPAGNVSAVLELACDEQGAQVLTGSFSAPLEAQCQRCLEWMQLAVAGNFELDVSEKNAANRLTAVRDEANLLEIENGQIPVLDLIEDEILLACPMIPLHDTPACHAAPEPAAKTDSPRRKPFAGLAELIETRPDGD